MHPGAFDYLEPTEAQIAVMNDMREAAAEYADAIEEVVPAGPDKTYLLRKFREVAMWVNVAITRQTDGAPRAAQEDKLALAKSMDDPNYQELVEEPKED